MKEIILLLAPHWWTLKNKLARFDRALYFRSVFVVLFGGGMLAGGVVLLQKALSRLQVMDAQAGRILTLKGLSLILLISFFILLFSGMITAISRFYLSQELPMILSFPVSRGRVYAVKWLETVVSASWMVLLFGIPLLVAFGLHFQVSLYYYPWLLIILVLFVTIPSGLGLCIAIVLMSVLPARSGKTLLMFLGILILGVLYLLFRLMKPEQMINPEWFANLTIFLANMQAPTSYLLPSMWAVEALGLFFQSGEGTPLFYLFLLASSSAAMMVFGYWLFQILFSRGWLKAQEGKKAGVTLSEPNLSSSRPVSFFGFYRKLILPFRKRFIGVRLALLEKDLHHFFRDEGQWSQIPLLIVLVIVYLFSIKALPLEWGTLVGLSLKYVVASLNIALAGIVLAAIASRFLFPAVSLEGKSFWIIQTAPMSAEKYLWSKYLIYLVPMLFLSLLLIGLSTYFLHVKSWMMFMSLVTGVVLTASITGLSVGMGAIYPQFDAANLSQVSTGLKGSYFMFLAILLILSTVALEALPTIGMFLAEINSSHLVPRGEIIIGLFLSAALLLNFFFLYIPMWLGKKRLSDLDRS